MFLHEMVSKKLSTVGDAWLSLVLIMIALFLMYIAFFDHNVTHKAIIATWVLMP